ncbi:membrane protein [Bacteroidia bacterium]|nr:membrane protein [Bacteroidia bacterium]
MQAQNDTVWQYKVHAGYNIGGSTPLPLPVEIRKINSFSPAFFSPHVAMEATRKMNENWGITVQIGLDYKGFSVSDEVKNLYTEIYLENNPDPQTGNFTGKNTTTVKNVYLTLPILASYQSDKWTTQFGIYTAYLVHADFQGTASDGYIRKGNPTGEKIEVPFASFDFSMEQNRFDYGLLAAEAYKLSPHFAVRGQLAWGLRSLFPSEFSGMPFKMRNIYGTVGISYAL